MKNKLTQNILLILIAIFTAVPLFSVFETSPAVAASAGAGQTGVVIAAPGLFSHNPALLTTETKISVGVDSSVQVAGSSDLLGLNQLLYAGADLGDVGSVGALINYYRFGIDYSDWKADWNELLVKLAYNRPLLTKAGKIDELRVGLGVSFGLIGGGDDSSEKATSMNVDIDAGVSLTAGMIAAGVSANNLLRRNTSFSRSISGGLGVMLKSIAKIDIIPIVEVGYILDYQSLDLRTGLIYKANDKLKVSVGCAAIDDLNVIAPTAGALYDFSKFVVQYSLVYNLAVMGSGDHTLGLGVKF